MGRSMGRSMGLGIAAVGPLLVQLIWLSPLVAQLAGPEPCPIGPCPAPRIAQGRIAQGRIAQGRIAQGRIAQGVPQPVAQPIPKRITFVYPPFGEFDLELQDLEQFAKTGTISPNFSFYARRATASQLELLRDTLNRKFDISPTLVSQFTYSTIGESSFRYLSELMGAGDTPAERETTAKALRAAFILAAAEKPDGLTVINVMRKFPLAHLRIKADRIREAVEILAEVMQRRDQWVRRIQLQSDEAAKGSPQLPPEAAQRLLQAGPHTWGRYSFNLEYTPAKPSLKAGEAPVPRRFAVDLYLPDALPNPAAPAATLAVNPGAAVAATPAANPVLSQAPIPVVVVSHGVAENRTTYTYLAQHLASHGFAVLALDHPGGNSDRIARYLAGLEASPSARELLYRPQDVSYVLDYFTQVKTSPQALQAALAAMADPQSLGTEKSGTEKSGTEKSGTEKSGTEKSGTVIFGNQIISGMVVPQGDHGQIARQIQRLDLNRVGVVGHSYGGYTVLALGGGRINYPRVQRDCNPNRSLNPSSYLQCRALELSASEAATEVADPRVQAVLAMNPLNSTVLGPEGMGQIAVPVMLVASSDDFLTPALPEQIRPFYWLRAPSKYLVMMRGATHFSVQGPPPPGSKVLPVPPELVGQHEAVAQGYMKALSTAFFQRYIRQNPEDVPLGASYAQRLSQSVMPLSLVNQALVPEP
jgi:predicted dienelactone hydrolase